MSAAPQPTKVFRVRRSEDSDERAKAVYQRLKAYKRRHKLATAFDALVELLSRVPPDSPDEPFL